MGALLRGAFGIDPDALDDETFYMRWGELQYFWAYRDGAMRKMVEEAVTALAPPKI